jgi:hypothetical protein
MDGGTVDTIAPGHGRYEVLGEQDSRLYRYCATMAEARQHVEQLRRFDQDNSWAAASPQEHRISPNDGNGRCPECGDPVPGSLPRNSTCDACRRASGTATSSVTRS